jgi:hypothetical protein
VVVVATSAVLDVEAALKIEKWRGDKVMYLHDVI